MNYRCAKIALQRNFNYNWNGWSYLDGYFDMVNEHSVESFTSRFDDNWMHLYRFSKSLNLGFSYILKKIAKFPDSFSFEIENIYLPPPLLWICLGSNRMWLMWLIYDTTTSRSLWSERFIDNVNEALAESMHCLVPAISTLLKHLLRWNVYSFRWNESLCRSPLSKTAMTKTHKGKSRTRGS